MNTLANMFPFVRDFIEKVIGSLGITGAENSYINNLSGGINLFILILMIMGILALLTGVLNLFFKFHASTDQEITKKHKQMKTCFFSGLGLLAFPLIAMIITGIGSVAIPI